ncbi:tyrosine-type recombinase/integrase [Streptomyces sp. H39-C1]|uniref:tyrosine-type recombinase/integrase n=1 Tax=Streptomyces sp. H39-C1 TaxID=3004355 RepID=UPI003FA68EC5
MATQAQHPGRKRTREPTQRIATPTSLHTASAETRHSYVTHLIEFGYPERFVQDQVGHRHGSTTALYTWVSDEYRNRLLEAHLQRQQVRPSTRRPDTTMGSTR